ncbi:SDR family oxidoreductase [Kovacikia minuta CCNUW1]|uniref:SDR family oxidoreductase n=1 Tax=Kovacikia minuta TaxID=2931930 RepID=UPI001CCA6FDD|nr:SDR family oxidoreductase [Kovacikia minuta]UBF26564.1 SDR family oxidoreductase [Kovacikia minuta CCNUW1]
MQDKVILIVGATGGIGSALVHKLLLTGARLALVAKDSDRLNQFVKQLPQVQPNQILAIPADITDPTQVEALMQKVVAHFGYIDVLVNAAGAGVMKQFNKLEPTDLDQMLDLNLKGSFYTSQAAANLMKDRKSGHICNVIGILGKHSMAMAAAYCASKFGAVGFSKCMAEELKRYGIKVTLFYFGGIDTPFWDDVSLKVDRTKMLRPETAADAILYTLSLEPQAVPLEVNIQPESHLFF